jgi:hypothetical protein
MHESLARVFNQCQDIAARRPDVICGNSKEALSVCRLVPALWIEVKVDLAVGGLSQIQVTEYRAREFKKHQTCCAWEAATLVEQILISQSR